MLVVYTFSGPRVFNKRYLGIVGISLAPQHIQSVFKDIEFGLPGRGQQEPTEALPASTFDESNQALFAKVVQITRDR